jgi:two-component system LytT family response regulator
MLRIVIADDELAARRRIKRLLLGAEARFEIVGEFADGAAAIEGIRRLKPDVAILDIQMPERDGLEVAAEVAGADAPSVVFVTAFDQYALRAFEVHAIDYLVKPVDATRLHATLSRLSPRTDERRATTDELARLARIVEELRQAHAAHADPGNRKRPRDRLLVTTDGRSVLVPVTEIDWIEAAGNYVRLHRGSTILMMRESLSSIESSLDSQTFVRVHRGAVVNIARIKEVQPWFSGAAVVILTTGQRLTISRSYRKQFEARFGIQDDD